MNTLMDAYHTLLKDFFENGTFKYNKRTDSGTLYRFSQHAEVDLQEQFPLLTTKKIYHESASVENGWYYSGQHHIRDLQKATNIWNLWQDDKGNLPSAYGRFWRRSPLPNIEHQLEGEDWLDPNNPRHAQWLNEEQQGIYTFDQLSHKMDLLAEDPSSRRAVISAWNPANAAESALPPCHDMYIFSVEDDEIHLHLTQRSGDIAIGIPFNWFSYGITNLQAAKQLGLKPGKFSHTIVDAHIYCGIEERNKWWNNNLDEFQKRFSNIKIREDYQEVLNWINREAPGNEGESDHVPGLITQMMREPKNPPKVEVLTNTFDDYAKRTIGELIHLQAPKNAEEQKKLKIRLANSVVSVENYNPHPPIKFGVAV